MRWPLFALVLTLVLALLACGPKTVVKLGPYSITETDVAQNGQILRLYYPEHQGDARQAALQQLTDAYRLAQILANHGRPVTDAVLQTEAERIDKSTLMPEMLSQIKAVFKNDSRAYQRVYVLPVYVKRVIYYEFFLHDPAIQAASLERAQKFLNSALGSAGVFTKYSTLKKFTVSLHDGLKWASETREKGRKRPPPPPGSSHAPTGVEAKLAAEEKSLVSAEGKRWIDEIISKLKPGQIHPGVIDQGEQWAVVRYLRPKSQKSKNTYELEAAIFPKENYAEWLAAEQAKVPVIYW